MKTLKSYLSPIGYLKPDEIATRLESRGDSVVNGQLQLGGDFGTLFGDYVDVEGLSAAEKMRVIEWFGFRGVPVSHSMYSLLVENIDNVRIIYNSNRCNVHWFIGQVSKKTLMRKIDIDQVLDDLDVIGIEKDRRSMNYFK